MTENKFLKIARKSFLMYLNQSPLLKRTLIKDGFQENIHQITCPAGIFISAIMPEEVALSIFAEIIELKRSGEIKSKKF